MSSNSRIGITGANGFIGRHLLHDLSARGCDVVGYVRRQPGDFSAQQGCRYEYVDLCSPASCAEMISNLDCVIHLAHPSYPLTSSALDSNEICSSLLPSLNLLQAAKRATHDIHLVYASSGGTVYTDHDSRRVPFRECDECLPMSGYGMEKLTIENYCRMCAMAGDLRATVLRISNPYGVLLPSGRKQGLIGVALSRMLEGLDLEIYGSIDNVRDYIHLDDLCRAFSRALDITSAYDVFNIGSGVGYRVRDILNIINRHTNNALRVNYTECEDAADLCSWSVLNVEKAREQLRWTPEIEFEQGLGMMCEDLK